MNVKFIMKNPKERKNSILVRVRIGRRVDLVINTRQVIDLNDWDAENGCLLERIQQYKGGKTVVANDAETKNRIVNNKNINYKLTDIRKRLEKNFSDNPNQIFSSEWLRDLLFPPIVINPKEQMTFVEYATIFLKDKGNTISKEYKTKVKTIIGLVEEYQSYKGFKSLILNQIDNEFKVGFESYLNNRFYKES